MDIGATIPCLAALEGKYIYLRLADVIAL